ncbi:MAG: nuclear transport factor 2 family protein [Actinomycetota bacterium]
MAHPNEELIQKGYDAFGKGDLDALNDLFADDIKWHTPGRSPIAGDLEGRDAVYGQFAKIAELSGGSFRLEIHDMLANDEHGVALVTAMGDRGGRSFSDNQVHVFHIKGGKVTEFWGHPGDQYAADEFWS